MVTQTQELPDVGAPPTVAEIMKEVESYAGACAFEAGSGRGDDVSNADVLDLVQRLRAAYDLAAATQPQSK